MPKYVRANATAVCWSGKSCQIIRLGRSRDQFKVLACWQSKLGQDQSLAELVVQGVKAVGCTDNEFIVAGGDQAGWGMADIEVPGAIGKEQLRGALAFELRKQTPIPPEKLLWGYRLLPGSGEQQNLCVRLFYVREEQWRKWLTVLSGLNHVDVILPAPLALDPLFANADIVFPAETGNSGYQACKAGSLRVVAQNINLAAMSFPEAFPPTEEYQLEALESLSRDEQMSCIPALILAAYGLSRESSRDQRTLISPPENLKARRNIASKIVAAALLVYIFATLVSGYARQFQAKAGHLRRIESETQMVQALLDGLKKQSDPAEKEFVYSLRQELQDNVQQMPDFPEALIELSNLIEAPTWASTRLEWNAGQITMQLQSSTRNLDLPEKLEESPILGDVRELSSQFNQGVYTQRYNLNARFDTEDEKLEFAQRQKKRLEAAKQQALEEAAPQETGTDDDSDATSVVAEPQDENGNAVPGAENSTRAADPAPGPDPQP